MDYEKKYKEALEKAHKLCAYPTSKPFISDLQDLFPELKESEDEEIRKAIIEIVKKDEERIGVNAHLKKIQWLEAQGVQINLPQFTFDDVLALQCAMEAAKKVQKDKDLYEQLKSLHDRLHDAYWFKKQGEKNLANSAKTCKVETKFKVGDKIRRKEPRSFDKDMQVARIEKDYYICNHIGKFSSEVVPFSKESSYELIEQKSAEWSEDDEVVAKLDEVLNQKK